MGHARAILGLHLKIYKKILANGRPPENLSVRQVERLIQGLTTKREAAPRLNRKEPSL